MCMFYLWSFIRSIFVLCVQQRKCLNFGLNSKRHFIHCDACCSILTLVVYDRRERVCGSSFKTTVNERTAEVRIKKHLKAILFYLDLIRNIHI